MKYIYLAGFILTTFWAINHFKDVQLEYGVRQNGKVVQGRIVEIPSICGRRNNRIQVEYGEDSYSLIISRNQCIRNEFSKGDWVDILYSKEENLAILPTRNVVISYYIAIGFFVMPIIFLTFLIKPNLKNE